MEERQQCGSQRARGVRRTVARTLFALAGMFVFAFALVPLYDVFCEVTGLNGKVDTQGQALVAEEVDQTRAVTVQFVTRTSAGLPWNLEVETRQIRVHPGQSTEVGFAFHNTADSAVWGRAVPSVTPARANLHLRKLACFCFEEQRLQAGERIELPLIFQLTRDLPADVNTVTLVYTLYPVDRDEAALQARADGDKGGEA
ncbi:cytochrome c oxidase assembly protein [Halomonas icarae]|uniref:Cytochrome c oxidase assembly protein CtaG n=1 Tax=Halomonas icarae TaxID=2691040 RepID=A0A7X5ALS6_9GAMM|nr:cytochrome c oxidase assembly protein [Halomonas icarae]MDR5902295.1 cytochrome c oxidase assembly protein [Halomonas icarae]NAW12104.1 cytochrome c oxidase assembly protein [Halomonas icarae]